jgi:hypothetical protein
MGLDAKGRKIVQCGIELLNVKEALSDLSIGELTTTQQVQQARLEQRKSDLLTEVGVLSAAESRE